jgi:pimeloyl-ACP methyl ester carboxylesterase
MSAATAERRYRAAEQAVWSHYGLELSERIVELDRLAVRLRVLELGAGEPVLFLPGSAGTGASWAPLVGELTGRRCVLVDPPNAGLSSRLDYADREYGEVIAALLAALVDALELDGTHVVGSSLGNVSALRLAAARPERVGCVVLLGAGPLLPESGVPGILRAIASPLGSVMTRLPASRPAARGFLRQIGHGRSLAAGRIPDELIDWRVALDRDTDTRIRERDMVRALVSWRTGLRPGLAFEDAELAAIRHRVLLLFGTADPTGTASECRRAVELLPGGELQLLDGAGHMPWLDVPHVVADHVERFLEGGSARQATDGHARRAAAQE